MLGTMLVAGACAGLRLPPAIGLRALFVAVRRSQLAIRVAIFVAAATLGPGFPFLILLTIAAQPREWQRLHPLFRDLQAARFAHAIGPGFEPGERIVDFFQLVTL